MKPPTERDTKTERTTAWKRFRRILPAFALAAVLSFLFSLLEQYTEILDRGWVATHPQAKSELSGALFLIIVSTAVAGVFVSLTTASIWHHLKATRRGPKQE